METDNVDDIEMKEDEDDDQDDEIMNHTIKKNINLIAIV